MELHLGLLAVWGYYASLALLRSAVLRVPQAAAVAVVLRLLLAGPQIRI